MHHNTAVVSVHELFTPPEPEPIDSSDAQEGTTDRDQFDTGPSNSEDSHRPGNFPQQISDHPSEDNLQDTTSHLNRQQHFR